MNTISVFKNIERKVKNDRNKKIQKCVPQCRGGCKQRGNGGGGHWFFFGYIFIFKYTHFFKIMGILQMGIFSEFQKNGYIQMGIFFIYQFFGEILLFYFKK